MSNLIAEWFLAHGNVISAPIGIQPRAVFDSMGQHVAHVEIFPNLRHTAYTIHAVENSAIVPIRGVYLGHVIDSHGQRVTHYYAVPHAG